MNKHDSAMGRGRPRNKSLLTLVALGIALFVVGFIVSVTSLSDPGTAQSGDFASEDGASGNSSLVLLMGLLLSLGGVVMATAGPAVMFIQARKGSY